eukprot:873276-Pyramimonas_sp.AAC.1
MESQACVQAFVAGVPGDPFVPPGSLAPSEYGPRALLQTLMRTHEILTIAYPESHESIEAGIMMLQDTDACDDSELVLAALTLNGSVRPEDVQRHVWCSRGRWREDLERAIAVRGQALPPPGW